MYWDDFAPLVRRHAAPHAKIRFVKTRFGPPDIVTIIDGNLPRRLALGIFNTGHFDDDWYRDTYVCNAAWLRGEIPLHSYVGLFKPPTRDNKSGSTIERPFAGVKDVLRQLLLQGVCVPSTELDRLTRMNTRSLAPWYMRLYYRER